MTFPYLDTYNQQPDPPPSWPGFVIIAVFLVVAVWLAIFA